MGKGVHDALLLMVLARVQQQWWDTYLAAVSLACSTHPVQLSCTASSWRRSQSKPSGVQLQRRQQKLGRAAFIMQLHAGMFGSAVDATKTYVICSLVGYVSPAQQCWQQ
jgi:hypothetical protein